MSKKIRRDIELITTELQVAQKREATDIIAIGGLLIETQGQLENGAGLTWLWVNFGSRTHTDEK